VIYCRPVDLRSSGRRRGPIDPDRSPMRVVKRDRVHDLAAEVLNL